MIKIERIRIFGVGASLITAMEGQNKFLRIMNEAECSINSHLQSMNDSLIRQGSRHRDLLFR